MPLEDIPEENVCVPDGNGQPFRFKGRKLGGGTSQRPDKDRWFEVDVYRDSRTNSYVLHTVGRTTRPGERQRYRLIITPSAYEVVERLVVAYDGDVYIPSQSMRAVTAAAQYDDDMLEAMNQIPAIIEARRAASHRSDARR